MKYKELQKRLKFFKDAGVANIQLNAEKSVLETEYQRCLALNLSLDELEIRIALKTYQDLNFVDAFEFYLSPEKFSLKTIQNKVYQLGKVYTLRELKETFPIIKDKKFNFHSKKDWMECLYLIDQITKGTQDLEQFQKEVELLVISLECQKYQGLEGQLATEEAYSDLLSYISWWKGAQWQSNLTCGASLQDLLKRAWLEQYLPKHGLGKLLEYKPNS